MQANDKTLINTHQKQLCKNPYNKNCQNDLVSKIKKTFENISLSRNTVAVRITDLALYLND